MAEQHPGPLALVGGNEWGAGCTFDASLLEQAGTKEVLVLPTAAAYEHPQRAVDTAAGWFATLGATVAIVATVPNPQSEPPITRSGPTTLAKFIRRWATSAGCST